MKWCLILLASSASAVPFGDQVDVPQIQDVVQHPDRLQELISRIEEVSHDIAAAPKAHAVGNAEDPQPSADNPVSDYIVSVLESVEASLSELIQFLGVGSESSPGSLPPATSATSTLTATGHLHTMPQPSSGMHPSSSIGTNTTYTPPMPPTQSTDPSESLSSSNANVDASPTSFPSSNETSDAPHSISSSTSDEPLPPVSTFSMQPFPTNMTIAPTGGLPTRNFTTLMPIPLPSSASETMPSSATSATSTPSAFAVAEQEIEGFLRWLLAFLEAQLRAAAGGNARRDN